MQFENLKHLRFSSAEMLASFLLYRNFKIHIRMNHENLSFHCVLASMQNGLQNVS